MCVCVCVCVCTTVRSEQLLQPNWVNLCSFIFLSSLESISLCEDLPYSTFTNVPENEQELSCSCLECRTASGTPSYSVLQERGMTKIDESDFNLYSDMHVCMYMCVFAFQCAIIALHTHAYHDMYVCIQHTCTLLTL